MTHKAITLTELRPDMSSCGLPAARSGAVVTKTERDRISAWLRLYERNRLPGWRRKRA